MSNFSGAEARLSAAFGQGIGPIFLNNVRCTGVEHSLFDCQHNGIGHNLCSRYTYDAGVVCKKGVYVYYLDCYDNIRQYQLV